MKNLQKRRNKNMKAKNIIWDTDGDEELREELPKEIEFPDELFDANDPYHEEICDYLSDQTGFCIELYEIEMPEPEPELEKVKSKTSTIIQSMDFKPRQTLPASERIKLFFQDIKDD